MPPEEVAALRQRLTGSDGSLLFLFVSQPMISLHRQNGMAEDHWGYTEETILTSIITCLERLTQELDCNITLVIRLHPKDEPDAYRKFLQDCTKALKLILDREIDSNLLLHAADLVIGMFSMLLLEAAILGRPLLSVQIGLKRENPLILDRLSQTRSILTEAELEQSLRGILGGKTHSSTKLQFEFGATERIVEYLSRYQ